MASFYHLLVFLAIIYCIAALPTSDKEKGECKKLAQRRAWHDFSNDEKRAYIDAELCLMSKPASQQLSAARTRFDELQALHQITTLWTHFVGAFLPWHRVFILAHETLLREDCDYKGHQPYWHEPMDAGNFMNSVVLDPVTGFGGNGSSVDLCITDGPFKDYVNPIGPYWANTDHCLKRKVNETFSARGAQHFVDDCMACPDYECARQCIQDRPHASGHGGMGAQMLDPIASPGDPLFYLHHTWMDKLWWNWQSLDLENRLTDMGGENVMPAFWFNQFPPLPPDWYPTPNPLPGDPGNVTTMNHVLDMMNIIPNRTIAEIMDIRKKPLCYEYVEPS